MKKILALAIGVLLVALAVPALAESPIDFSGRYRVIHVNHNNYGRSDTSDGQDSQSAFYHHLQLSVTFHATEDIDVGWVFRAPGWRRWGQDAIGATSTFQTRAFYATIRQPWGTVSIGRFPDGHPGTVGGLATLGHEPSWGPFGYVSSVFNFNNFVDGITYNHDFGNGFGLAAYYFKQASTDYDPEAARPVKDADVDRLGIEPRYTWDGGGFTLGFVYVRDKSDFGEARLDDGDSNVFFDYDDLVDLYDDVTGYTITPTDEYFIGRVSTDSNYTFIINPAFTQSWGAFSLGFEAAFGWSKTKYLAELALWDSTTTPNTEIGSIIHRFEVESKGYGLFLDGNYNYGAGDITLALWLADGTDFENDEDAHDLIGLGDFCPFLVAFGYNGVGLGYPDSLNTFAYGNTPIISDLGIESPSGTNQWGIGLLGNHSVTDDIVLNWGLGYFALVEPINSPFYRNAAGNIATSDRARNNKKDLGWEIDLGATFNLLDNLVFSTQFGYFFNGGAYDQFDYNGATNTFTWMDAKDTFAWVNYLNVAF